MAYIAGEILTGSPSRPEWDDRQDYADDSNIVRGHIALNADRVDVAASFLAAGLSVEDLLALPEWEHPVPATDEQ